MSKTKNGKFKTSNYNETEVILHRDLADRADLGEEVADRILAARFGNVADVGAVDGHRVVKIFRQAKIS